MTDLFCKDCKHSRGELPRLTCDSPLNFIDVVDEAQYLVTGDAQPTIRAMRGASCSTLRVHRDAETEATCCGPSGKWFEPKEST